MKILLNVEYSEGTRTNGKGSFWADSDIKNRIVTQQEDETIHDTVKRVLTDNDGAEMSYNGKPTNNIYIDTPTGSKIVGYIYRVKHFISDRSANIQCTALFNAWVTIKKVEYIELAKVEVID
jgi:hypothetical protein